MSAAIDAFQRPLTSLRLSVTDRCNLRCLYCMPEAEYSWLPKSDILDFEEIVRLTKVFVGLGVRRVRLTGGEPLLRRDLPALVAQLAAIDGVEDLALTTNGVLLADQAEALRAAGLQRITVSLDTLDRDTFVRLTRADELGRVRSGLEAAARVFPGFKIDTVVVRGVNDGEIVALLAEARRLDAELRFIEYMDVGGATGWTGDQVVSRRRDPGDVGERTRTCHARRVRSVRAGHALPPGHRSGGRHHRVDDDAVLLDVRSESSDGGRHVVHVPLRVGRPRRARAAARGRERRRPRGDPAAHVGAARRIAARKIDWPHAIAAPSCRPARSSEIHISKCTRGVDSKVQGSGFQVPGSRFGTTR